MMIKNNLRLGMVLLTTLAFLPAVASAQSVGSMATDWQAQIGNLSLMVVALAFLLGIGIAIVGLLKLKKANENPNDPSASKPAAFALIFVGAAMVGLPLALGSGLDTIFGSQTDALGASGGWSGF